LIIIGILPENITAYDLDGAMTIDEAMNYRLYLCFRRSHGISVAEV
jgi:hypothetical protein